MVLIVVGRAMCKKLVHICNIVISKRDYIYDYTDARHNYYTNISDDCTDN